MNAIEFALSFGNQNWVENILKQRDRLVEAAMPHAEDDRFYSPVRISADFNNIVEILLNK